MDYTFPKDDTRNPILSGKLPNGQPFMLDTSGFPADENGKDGDDGEDANSRTPFLAIVWNYIGDDIYRIFRFFKQGKTSGRVIRAKWEKNRAYDPPLAADTWVVAQRGADGQCSFVGPACQWALGDQMPFSGTAPAADSGWLLISNANHLATDPAHGGTAVNGIIVPDSADKFPVVAGATYVAGATGGAVNHTHTVTATGKAWTHTHDVVHNGQTPGDHYHAQDGPGVAGGITGGVVGSDGNVADLYAAAQGATTDDNSLLAAKGTYTSSGNEPPYYASAWKIFVGC